MGPFGLGWGAGVVPAPRSVRLRRGRCLVGLGREAHAGSVGDVGRDAPGRVLGLAGAGVIRAEPAPQALGVDAELIGKRLRRERGGRRIGHVGPLSVGRASRIGRGVTFIQQA